MICIAYIILQKWTLYKQKDTITHHWSHWGNARRQAVAEGECSFWVPHGWDGYPAHLAPQEGWSQRLPQPEQIAYTAAPRWTPQNCVEHSHEEVSCWTFAYQQYTYSISTQLIIETLRLLDIELSLGM